MRAYDQTAPLIFAHVPKTAGTSVRSVFQAWYGTRLLPHYPQKDNGGRPVKYDVVQMHSAKEPAVIYGHFNREKGFGIEDYYPEASQFVTVLRDPVERVLSGYFYMRSQGIHMAPFGDLRNVSAQEYVDHADINMFKFLPAALESGDFEVAVEERFVEIGLTEHLEESLSRIAVKLSKPSLPAQVVHLNATQKKQSVDASLETRLARRIPREMALYDYVRTRFAAS